MLALIKKDFQIFNPFVYLFLSLLIFGMAYVSLPAIFMMVIGAFAVGFSTFTYDEKNKTNIAVVSMPIKKQTMVISRYLYSVGILVIILFIEWIGTNISYSSTFEPYTFIDFLMLFAVGLVLFAICYPILYFFNNSYVAMLIIFLFLIIGTFFTIDGTINIMGMTDEIIFNRHDKGLALLAKSYIPFQPYLLVLLASIVLFIASIKISTLLLQRKDLS